MPRSKNRHTRRAQKARQKDRRRERKRNHEDLANRGCPTPSKVGFSSREDAVRARERAWSRGNRQSGGAAPLPSRVYKCPCGMFHLTSAPKRR